MRVENLLKFNTEIIFYNHYRNTGSEFQLSVVKFLILNSTKVQNNIKECQVNNVQHVQNNIKECQVNNFEKVQTVSGKNIV